MDVSMIEQCDQVFSFMEENVRVWTEVYILTLLMCFTTASIFCIEPVLPALSARVQWYPFLF